MIGRQRILVVSASIHVALNIVMCFSQDLATLLVLRFLSGAFGAAPLTNSGGVIADTFPPKDRGLAITVYALVPLFAPVLGPIVGGYVAVTFGWRWLMEIMALLSASALVASLLALPETYAPVILRKRAQRLSSMNGHVYVSATTSGKGKGKRPNLGISLPTSLSRPFVLAVHEPIILILSLYQAIIFGTLYLTFAAFPIVYIDLRGWSPESSGISFVGVLVGMLFSVFFQIWDNRRYAKLVNRMAPDVVPPETRLPGSCLGGISIVLGLFWFAWTTSPDIHWAINTAAGIPFGFGIVLVTISSTNYLVDSYTVFAASALTVCICARATCGAVFPLFVRGLFASLGVKHALSLPALLALLCAPFPFVFYRYGPAVRAKCRYAEQAEQALQQARRPVDDSTPLLAGSTTSHA